MCTIHQLASASLVGVFFGIMLFSAHLFADYRAAKTPSFQIVDVVRSMYDAR